MSSSPVDKPLPLANTFDELSGPPVDVSVSWLRQTDTWTPRGLAIAVATRGLVFVADVGLEETRDFETANLTRK